MRRFWLSCAALVLINPSSLMAEPIGKVRGPLDKFRQFTPHFEFAVPRDVSVARACVVSAIAAAAGAESKPLPQFKSKLSKKGNVSVEKLTWKGKTDSGYTYKEEVTFTFAPGWTHVDIDNRFYRLNEETDRFENDVATFHARCGLALGEAFPADMPLPLAAKSDADDVKLRALSPKPVPQLIECLTARDEDDGGGKISTTFVADHTGAFYAYYITRFDNLGTIRREYYAVKASPSDTGSVLELLAPDISLGSNDPAQLRRENFGGRQIEKCSAAGLPSTS